MAAAAIVPHLTGTELVPRLGHVEDHAIPVDEVRKLEQAWPNVTFHIYDAQHGFNCEQRGSYDKASADVAQDRTFAFFAEKLA